MDMVLASLAGLGHFILYFVVGILMLVIFKILYAMVTPHNEWDLIKNDKNTTAAVAFSGAIVGFGIALAGAAKNSVSLLDFTLWGVIALAAQILAFAIVRFLFMPKISDRIRNNEMAAGIVLAGVSIAVGLINGACMTY
jgi:putative membrane protein